MDPINEIAQQRAWEARCAALRVERATIRIEGEGKRRERERFTASRRTRAILEVFAILTIFAAGFIAVHSAQRIEHRLEVAGRV